jgi:hypothetical protein
MTRGGRGCLLVALVACASTAPTPTLTGRWAGTATASGKVVTIDFVVAQDGVAVTGSGTTASSAGSAAATITGTCTYPNISLSFTSAGLQPWNFTGQFENADLLTGQVNGSGFVNVAWIFRRVP